MEAVETGAEADVAVEEMVEPEAESEVEGQAATDELQAKAEPEKQEETTPAE